MGDLNTIGARNEKAGGKEPSANLEPKMIFKQIPFRFEAMWSSDTRYNDVVKENWHILISNNNHNYFENVERLQKETKNWYKSVFGNIYNGIESALANLNFAHNAFDISPTVEDKSYMVNCLCDYLNLLKLEEIFWRQKYRVESLKYGDLNTKFFHTSTPVRRRRNSICKLKDSAGKWLTSAEDIEKEIVNHFSFIFNSTTTSLDRAEIESLFPSIIFKNENNNITREVSVTETKSAMRQLGSLKAPGPDGF
ncbi:uncharacterized protein LOC113272770 [Papaver somniferum]|uniref:uncharacterized protein LOC113272770 n=1 Tax=Papaver somniferum TaxID=3469 RepID=UPI000E705400|nr:uncharacterized protein LOC113272770 [Papaver somniferum]